MTLSQTNLPHTFLHSTTNQTKFSYNTLIYKHIYLNNIYDNCMLLIHKVLCDLKEGFLTYKDKNIVGKHIVLVFRGLQTKTKLSYKILTNNLLRQILTNLFSTKVI